MPTLSEMTLPAPGAVPPIELPGVSTRTPTSALPSFDVPFTSVPIKLPWTLFDVALLVPR